MVYPSCTPKTNSRDGWALVVAGILVMEEWDIAGPGFTAASPT